MENNRFITSALIFERVEEVVSTLTAFAKENACRRFHQYETVIGVLELVYRLAGRRIRPLRMRNRLVQTGVYFQARKG
jgi:hypothetical protein